MDAQKQKIVIGLLCALLVVTGIVLIAASTCANGQVSNGEGGVQTAALGAQNSSEVGSNAGASVGPAENGEGEGAGGPGAEQAGQTGAQAGSSPVDAGGSSALGAQGSLENPGAASANGAAGSASNPSNSSNPAGSGAAGTGNGSPSADSSQATFQIECTSVLSRMDQLSSGVASNIPASGELLARSTVNFAEGSSVFDLLKQACNGAGITMRYNGGNFGAGVYVTTIGPLSEFDCGAQSGWKYYVNGQQPSIPCSAYVVKPGDSITWQYTCEL